MIYPIWRKDCLAAQKDCIPIFPMNIGFDAYSLIARILPGYVTLAPIILLLVFLPSGLQLSAGAAILVLPIIYFLSYQIGRPGGKRKEQNLWAKWGGAPTTRFLRHSSSEFDAERRARTHSKLERMGINVPTHEKEDEDQAAADEIYQRCTYELIRRTRNVEDFPLVYRALTSYGMHRNLLGLKPFGISVALFSIAACVAYGAYNCDSVSLIIMALSAGIANLGLLIMWLFGVTEKAVKLAAEEYARFLLEAALGMED